MKIEIREGDMIAIRERGGSNQINYLVTIEEGYGGRDIIVGRNIATAKKFEFVFLSNAISKPSPKKEEGNVLHDEKIKH